MELQWKAHGGPWEGEKLRPGASSDVRKRGGWGVHSEYGGLILSADCTLWFIGVHEPRGAALWLGISLLFQKGALETQIRWQYVFLLLFASWGYWDSDSWNRFIPAGQMLVWLQHVRTDAAQIRSFLVRRLNCSSQKEHWQTLMFPKVSLIHAQKNNKLTVKRVTKTETRVSDDITVQLSGEGHKNNAMRRWRQRHVKWRKKDSCRRTSCDRN